MEKVLESRAQRMNHEILLNFVPSFVNEYFKSSVRNFRYIGSICQDVSSLTEIQYLQNELNKAKQKLSEMNLIFVDE